MSIFKKLFSNRNNDEEPPEFEALIDESMDGLRLQTEAHQSTWRFGQSERWHFAQDVGELVFTFQDMIVHTPAQIIGSFDPHENSWLWAWGNPSISEPLTHNSIRTREYGENHHIRRLTTPSWWAKEIDGWHMAALANRLTESNGVYRGPAGAAFVFFTFGKVLLKKHP